MNVLVSSAGRRGALMKLIQDTIAPMGGRVFACDAGRWSAACRLAADWALVPRCKDPAFPEVVLDLCQRWNIRLLIPTIDTELPIYARVRDQFLAHGITIGISGPQTIAIGGDKIATHQFLKQHQFPTVAQYDDLPPGEVPPLPVIIKPRFGSASNGVQLVEDADAYQFFHRRTAEPIVQELAHGTEYTVNFFVGRSGRCLAAVPHRRIETRGGEVSKSVTHNHAGLMELAERFAATLPDAFGAMCFQAFLQPDGQMRIIELNCRFGGGYPMAHAAGVNFIQWLLDAAQGTPEPSTATTWQNGLAMLRWDDAVFTSGEGLAA